MIYNAFEHTGVDGILLPNAAMGKLRNDPVTLALYVYVLDLQRRQRTADRTVTAHIDTLVESLDLSKPVLRTARQELGHLGLVSSSQGSKRGMWIFKILHPETGTPLPLRPRNNVEFANVSDFVAMEFYRREMPGSEAAPGRFSCPFCVSSGAQFTVTLARGTEAHGTWKCRKCPERKDAGSFVAFYMRKHRVGYGAAIGTVNAILHGLILEEQQRKEQGLPEPTLPAPMRQWEEQMMVRVGIEPGDPSMI